MTDIRSKPHLRYKEGWWYLWESRMPGVLWFCRDRKPHSAIATYNNVRESMKWFNKRMYK